MTLRRCIDDTTAKGEVDKDRGETARATYDDLVKAYIEAGMDPKLAEIKASTATIDALKVAAAEKRRQALLQMNAQAAIMRNLEAKGDDWGRTAVAHFDFDERVPGVSNLAARHRAIRGRAHAKMVDVLATFKRDLLGRVRKPADLDNMVREIFGADTGDASARELAKAWKETAEFLRQKFNAAGGAIGKRDDWGMPQHHDMLAVRKAGKEEWVTFIRPMLDRAKMVHETTGLPLSEEALSEALSEVYDTISSDGWNKLTPRGMGGGKKLANRRADSRFLVFKDADGWLEYQERFGSGTPFDVMFSHIDQMARDIAQLEILGPNPNVTRKWMEQTVTKRAVERDIAEGGDENAIRARVSGFQMEAIYGQYTGTLNAPVSPRLARFMGGYRSLQTASKLGGAVLSAVTDLGFANVTARFNGLPYRGVIAKMVSLLNPRNKADRKLAVRLGLIADEWSQVAAAQQRYVDEVNTPELINRLADGVLRLSGLSAWTQAGKWAFGMEFMGHLGDMASKPFDKLDVGVRRALERYGLNAADWEAVRSTPLYDHEGATFLRPEDIAAREDIDPKQADRLATALLEMVQSETRYAVPEASLRAKAVTTANLRPGTIPGEIMRSVAQFKAFPITILFTHVARSLYGKGGMSRAQYAANLMIATTVMGALALQLKQIAAGKDPQDMSEQRFWGAATIQGGGAGIFGDFLFSDENRFGGGIEETLSGPALATTFEIIEATKGNAQLAAEGKKTKFGWDLAKVASANTPGTSLWYLRLGYNRLFLDQVRKELDPDYRGAFRRMERRAKRDFNQEYWWGPGDASADRAPDMEAALDLEE